MCDNCDWEILVEDVEELQEDSEYEFASTTLEGILDWVTENEHCTEAQKIAVQNIKESIENGNRRQ